MINSYLAELRFSLTLQELMFTHLAKLRSNCAVDYWQISCLMADWQKCSNLHSKRKYMTQERCGTKNLQPSSCILNKIFNFQFIHPFWFKMHWNAAWTAVEIQGFNKGYKLYRIWMSFRSLCVNHIKAKILHLIKMCLQASVKSASLVHHSKLF